MIVGTFYPSMWLELPISMDSREMYTLKEYCICFWWKELLGTLVFSIYVIAFSIKFWYQDIDIFPNIQDKWDWLKKISNLNKAIVAVTVISVLLVFFIKVYGGIIDVCRVPFVMEAFNRGTPPAPTIQNFVERPEIGNLTATFTSPKASRYLVIFGERGTGKTSILKRACHAAGPGVLYITVPIDPTTFSDVFAAAIDYPFYEGRTFWQAVLYATGLSQESGDTATLHLSSQDPHQRKWNSCYCVLEKAALRWHAFHKKPLVVVIDDADILAEKAEGFLVNLQQSAKRFADSGTVVFIFTSSEGHAPAIMRAQSEWSRSQFIEIGDLEEQAALKFLTNRRVEENVALDAIHTFLGGRIIDLQTAAYEYNNGSESSMQTINKVMMLEIDERYERAGLGQPYDKRMWSVLKVMLDSESLRIPRSMAKQILSKSGNSSAMLDKACKANVLSQHFDEDGLISFNCPVAAAFAKQVACIKGSPERKKFDSI